MLNKFKTSNTERLALTVTYSKTLPDLKTIINKNWHILQIEPKLKEVFAEPPILAFKRNKKCQPCYTRSINLCCKRLKTCSTFQSVFNKNTFLIRHNVTCKSSSVIYLMECCLCQKSQYNGKSEYSVNLRINTHRNDVWRTYGPPCDKHFRMPGHNCNTHAKLEHREDFGILKLQTLSLQGLNISLNYSQDTTGSIC